jgi:formate-dependent nitrite reductase cytochrome c552 subunit
MRKERKRIITKLQERVQELNAEVEKLQQEIIFNQSIIRELIEQLVETSDDEISIEIIPNIMEESRTKQGTSNKINNKKAERKALREQELGTWID